MQSRGPPVPRDPPSTVAIGREVCTERGPDRSSPCRNADSEGMTLPHDLRQPPVPLIAARDDSHLDRAIRAGELTRVSRGMYTPSAAWSSLAPWERYAARVHAVVRTHPDIPVCLESAAVVRGQSVFGDPGPVHLLGTPDRVTARRTGDIIFHTTAESREIEMTGGILVTSAVDTAVDLARHRHAAIGLAYADHALRDDPSLTVEQLVARNESRQSSRGRRRARWALHRASALPESVLESLDRAVIEFLGLLEPELQVWVGRDRVDKWWPSLRIAGEGDGDLKYDGRYGDASQALRQRHVRDARLIAVGARSVPHWGWSEVVAIEPLYAILTTAGVPAIRPRDTASLASLRRAVGGR